MRPAGAAGQDRIEVRNGRTGGLQHAAADRRQRFRRWPATTAFWLVPGVVPEALTVAPAGPAVTLVETPRANPPASACMHRGVGDLRPVALDRDVEIVLERQRDRVLQREVQVAAAQQRFEAAGIRQVRAAAPRGAR